MKNIHILLLAFFISLSISPLTALGSIENPDCYTIQDRIRENCNTRNAWNEKYLFDEEGRKAHIEEKTALTHEYEELEKEKYLCRDELDRIEKEKEEQDRIKVEKEKEVNEAKKALGSKAAIFESLVPLFKAKDSKTQENVKALLKTFTQSKDAYTRNIGIYFGYLVE